MNNALKDLIKISNATGRDTALVQAGGGNTSVKTADGKYMYIKASGTALKDMNMKNGWRRLRLDVVLPIIEDKSIARLDTQAREAEVKNRLLLACQPPRLPPCLLVEDKRGGAAGQAPAFSNLQ